MARRLGVGVVVLGVVLGLAVAGGPVRAVLPWALFGYLLWRAAPGVVVDLRGLRGRLPVSRRGRFSLRSARGERL